MRGFPILLLLLCAPAAADPIGDAVIRVETWIRALPAPAPDLTILTTEPIADCTSSGFGWRDDPIRHDERFHTGTDFKADPGTPVVAAGDGIVTYTGRLGGYGNVIFIDHGGGVVTRYAHLSKIAAAKGDVVGAGTKIGEVGSTGRTTGPHLHFEIRLEGRAVDPVMAMTVAGLEREQPEAGKVAAFALAPELQRHVHDDHDPPRKKRQQVLW